MSDSRPTTKYGAPWLPIAGGQPVADDPWGVAPAAPESEDSTSCLLCGAPGGYPYCNDDCRGAAECECTGDTCTC